MSARLGKAFRISKDGKIIRAKRRLAVSEHIRQKSSKRVKVVKSGHSDLNDKR